MRKIGLITVILLSLFIVAGCLQSDSLGKRKPGVLTPLNTGENGTGNRGDLPPIALAPLPPTESTPVPPATPPVETQPLPPTSPFLGRVMATAELIRPIMVMVENAPAARPQAGLEDASIVYEFLVEGGITRFLALFYEKFPERIGPVRSTRPYFVHIADEYDALLLHVGASTEGYRALAATKINEIDQLVAPEYFWRDKNRRMPHNCYTGKSKLVKYFKKYSVPKDVPARFGYQAVDVATQTDAKAAKVIKMRYWSDYTAEYRYDAAKGSYLRYINGTLHLMEGGKKIYADNIFIQYVDTKVKDKAGRLELKLTGSGKALLFKNGLVFTCKWEKNNDAKTVFLDAAGNEVKLNPGQTWIQVVSLSTKIEY